MTVDHHQWSADTAKQPTAILPLILYQNWMNLDPIDLRGADLSVYLRGDDLKCWRQGMLLLGPHDLESLAPDFAAERNLTDL